MTAPLVAAGVMDLLDGLKYPFFDGVVPGGTAQPGVYGLAFFPMPLRSTDRKSGRQVNTDVEYRMHYVGSSPASARWCGEVAEAAMLGARLALPGRRSTPIRQEWVGDVMETDVKVSDPSYVLLGVYRFSTTPVGGA